MKFAKLNLAERLEQLKMGKSSSIFADAYDDSSILLQDLKRVTDPTITDFNIKDYIPDKTEKELKGLDLFNQGFVKNILETIGQKFGTTSEQLYTSGTESLLRTYETSPEEFITSLKNMMPPEILTDFIQDAKGIDNAFSFLSNISPKSIEWINVLNGLTFKQEESLARGIEEEISSLGSSEELLSHLEEAYTDTNRILSPEFLIKYNNSFKEQFTKGKDFDSSKLPEFTEYTEQTSIKSEGNDQEQQRLLKYIDYSTHPDAPLMYIINSFFKKKRHKDLAVKVLMHGTEDEKKDLYAHIILSMTTDPEQGLPKSPLSLIAAKATLVNLLNDAERKLNSNFNALGSIPILKDFLNNEDTTIYLNYDVNANRNLSEATAPILTNFIADKYNIPVEDITIPSLIDNLHDYLKEVYAIQRGWETDYTNRLSNLVNDTINIYAKEEDISINRATMEVLTKLGFIDRDLSDLDIQKQSYTGFTKIKDIVDELNSRVNKTLRSRGLNGYEFYTAQLLSHSKIITIYDNLINAGYSHENAISNMANKLFSFIDVKKTTLSHMRELETDSKGFLKTKELTKFKLQDIIDSYEKYDILLYPSLLFTPEVVADSLEDIIKSVRGISKRTSKSIHIGKRRFHYKDLQNVIQAQKEFGVFESELDVLKSTFKKQVELLTNSKYLTINNTKSILDEITNLSNVVKSKTQSEVNSIFKSTALTAKYNMLMNYVNSMARDRIETVPFQKSKFVQLLDSLFYTTALSGNIITSVFNDFTTVSILNSPTFKEGMSNGLTYLRSLFGTLSKDELNIVGGAFNDITRDEKFTLERETKARYLGDRLYSNASLAYSGRIAGLLTTNRALAQEVKDGVMGTTAKRLNLWLKSTDTKWFETLIRDRDLYLGSDEYGPFILLNNIKDFELKDALLARITAWTDTMVPEKSLLSSSLNASTHSLPDVLKFLAQSVLLFKSPMITETETSLNMLKNVRPIDSKLFYKYMGTSLFQSLVYHYFKAKGNLQDIYEEKKRDFYLSVILDSPLFGSLGNITNDFIHGDTYDLFSNRLSSPITPIISSMAAIPSYFTKPTVTKRQVAYDIAKNMTSYSIIKNYPILGGYFKKIILKQMYDAIYPDNRYYTSMNTYYKKNGLYWDK